MSEATVNCVCAVAPNLSPAGLATLGLVGAVAAVALVLATLVWIAALTLRGRGSQLPALVAPAVLVISGLGVVSGVTTGMAAVGGAAPWWARISAPWGVACAIAFYSAAAVGLIVGGIVTVREVRTGRYFTADGSPTTVSNDTPEERT